MCFFLKPIITPAILVFCLLCIVSVSWCANVPSIDIIKIETSKNGGILADFSLLGKNGRPPQDSTKEHFTFKIDDTPIDDFNFTSVNEPLSLLLAVDTSGSMVGKPLQKIKEGCSIILNLLDDNDYVALMAFGSQVRLVLDFTRDRELLLEKLFGLQALEQETLLYEAINRSIEISSEAPDLKTAVVMFSDGVDEGSTLRMKDVIEKFGDVKTPFYFFYFEKNPEFKFIKNMAIKSGGQLLTSPYYKDFMELNKMLSAIPDSRYSVELPKPGKEGEHRLDVLYNGKDGKVFTSSRFISVKPDSTESQARVYNKSNIELPRAEELNAAEITSASLEEKSTQNILPDRETPASNTAEMEEALEKAIVETLAFTTKELKTSNDESFEVIQNDVVTLKEMMQSINEKMASLMNVKDRPIEITPSQEQWVQNSLIWIIIFFIAANISLILIILLKGSKFDRLLEARLEADHRRNEDDRRLGDEPPGAQPLKHNQDQTLETFAPDRAAISDLQERISAMALEFREAINEVVENALGNYKSELSQLRQDMSVQENLKNAIEHIFQRLKEMEAAVAESGISVKEGIDSSIKELNERLDKREEDVEGRLGHMTDSLKSFNDSIDTFDDTMKKTLVSWDKYLRTEFHKEVDSIRDGMTSLIRFLLEVTKK